MILKIGKAGTAKSCFIAPLLFAGVVLGMVGQLWASNPVGKTVVFPDIEGWKRSDDIQTYLPKTLYEYINGGADIYLSYDFQEVYIAEYQNNKEATVTVEIYRHKTPLDAFGIYSQERLASAEFFDIGAQGHGVKDFLNVVTGPYYVKITSDKVEDHRILITFATKVAENLGGKATLPSILAAFPPEGKVRNSEKFIAKNFLGYSFFHAAFIADYDLAGQKFQIFVIHGEDKKQCDQMIHSYLKQTGNGTRAVSETRFTLSDPHHGEMDFIWKEELIWGILNLNDPVLGLKYLKCFEEGLSKIIR